MRLEPWEILAIQKVIGAADPAAQIYLFGSRVHDNLQGGDIDLLVWTRLKDAESKAKIHTALMEKLGEQKIDLVFTTSLDHTAPPFVQLILQKAIRL